MAVLGLVGKDTSAAEGWVDELQDGRVGSRVSGWWQAVWFLESGQGVTLEDGRLVGWVDSERMLESLGRQVVE